jgi:hypothetical protein
MQVMIILLMSYGTVTATPPISVITLVTGCVIVSVIVAVAVLVAVLVTVPVFVTVSVTVDAFVIVLSSVEVLVDVTVVVSVSDLHPPSMDKSNTAPDPARKSLLDSLYFFPSIFYPFNLKN